MRVECPNCSTTYEVPAVHFVDGVRRLRCTQCGYRWNQSASDADLNDSKKSTPLLDMLERDLSAEKWAAVQEKLPSVEAIQALGRKAQVYLESLEWLELWGSE